MLIWTYNIKQQLDGGTALGMCPRKTETVHWAVKNRKPSMQLNIAFNYRFEICVFLRSHPTCSTAGLTWFVLVFLEELSGALSSLEDLPGPSLLLPCALLPMLTLILPPAPIMLFRLFFMNDKRCCALTFFASASYWGIVPGKNHRWLEKINIIANGMIPEANLEVNNVIVFMLNEWLYALARKVVPWYTHSITSGKFQCILKNNRFVAQPNVQFGQCPQ